MSVPPLPITPRCGETLRGNNVPAAKHASQHVPTEEEQSQLHAQNKTSVFALQHKVGA